MPPFPLSGWAYCEAFLLERRKKIGEIRKLEV